MLETGYQKSSATKEPLISILINNYNYGRFLPQAIDSALDQTYSNFEIIVVDDGSTDNSQEIILNYGDQIIPIFQKNGGQASAFNTGFANSRGEIICFLDSDDIFLPEKLIEIANVFIADSDIGWCFHILDLFVDDDHLEKLQKPIIGSSGKVDLRSLIKQGKFLFPNVNMATSSSCFRRSLLEQILPMTEDIRITSDDYIKYISVGLTPGFILFKNLAKQRIHHNNAYTLRADKDKQKLKSKITILTGYWMKHNFPLVMSKFSNNLFAIGISLYYFHNAQETESEKLMEKYLKSATLLEKSEIYLRAFYNYMKFVVKGSLKYVTKLYKN